MNTDYTDRVVARSRWERFLDYGDWYTKTLVPDVRDHTVTELTSVEGGFRATFADSAPVTARQVVVATGVLPYRRIPVELAGLDAELVTHTADHRDLSQFEGVAESRWWEAASPRLSRPPCCTRVEPTLSSSPGRSRSSGTRPTRST